MTKCISFYEATHVFGGNFEKIDLSIIEKYSPELLYGDEESLAEIKEAYLTDLNKIEIKKLTNMFPDLRFGYCDCFNKFVLLTDFCKTSWKQMQIELNELI